MLCSVVTHPGALLKPIIQRFFAYKVFFRRTGMEKMKNAELPLQKQILGFIDRLMTNRLSAIRFFIPAVLAEYDDI